MRWRDVLIGAMVTLIGTVISGVIVFYLTQQRPLAPPTEQLVYETDRPFSFETESTKNTFQDIRVANLGNQAASNVVLGVQFPMTQKLLDYKVRFSGPPGTISAVERADSELRMTVRNIAPQETVTVTAMLGGIPLGTPTVGVRSDASIGIEGSTSPTPRRASETVKVSSILPILAVVGQVLILVLLRSTRVRAFIKRFIPTTRSVNNTAFMYIHTGLTATAERLLCENIFRGGADGYMLANYGLALGLNGQLSEGMKHLDAAQFYVGDNRHEAAVVHFNRALLLFQSGDIEDGEREMRAALARSGKEIRRYCGFSSVVRELESKVPRLKALTLQIKTQGRSSHDD